MAPPIADPEADNPSRTKLYENIAFFPELGRFRRFAAEWSKLIHDDTREVLFCKEMVSRELMKIDPMLRKGDADVLEVPRHVVAAKYPRVYKTSWKRYEVALRRYGRDLCTSSQIMQLPEQVAYATAFLGTFGEPTFIRDSTNGKRLFGLTQEEEEFYSGPSAKYDGCAWREPPTDYLVGKISEVAPWFSKNVSQRFRSSKMHSRTQNDTAQPTDPPYVQYRVLVKVMDTLICIFASQLLMGTMFVLESIVLTKTRIGAAGALGTVFSVLIMLLAGPSRRIEVYAATAAFFAVACEFMSKPEVGVTDS